MNEVIDIMLVDNSDADARTTMKAVRRAAPSASVLRVKDGEQALRFLFRRGLFTREPQLPRLILLDLTVPIINGRRVLERVRTHATTNNIPVIVLTSQPDARAVHESYALGAQAFVAKSAEACGYVCEVSNHITTWLRSA
jgi:two-component system, response regulator